MGAGADILIARDFSPDESLLPPNWTRLISELSPFTDIVSTHRGTQTQVEALAQSWPAEAASLARWWSGDKAFQTDIRTRLDDLKIIDRIKKGVPQGTSTYQMCQILLQSNLIITPNYSSYLVHALRTFDSNRHIAVIDREDLPSLPFPESEKNPAVVFVIHLHGRCSARSFPVLDAWGYNILEHDDQVYLELLRRLFTDRSVVTIGVSWSDPPLRSAAAFVQRRRPYLSKRHLAFYFVSPEQENIFGKIASKPDSKSVARLWSNAIRAAYGVDVLFVNGDTQYNVLRQFGQRYTENYAEDAMRVFRQRLYDAREDYRKLTDVWHEIADLFDSCGDYESPLQHRFLRVFSGVPFPTAEAVAEATHDLAEKLITFLQNGDKGTTKRGVQEGLWSIAARIERHLRHHLYLYRRRKPSQIRLALWQLLWRSLPKSQWHDIPAQLRFDFLLGKFELQLQHVNLTKHQAKLGFLEDRFLNASRIWSHPPGPLSRALVNDKSGQRRVANAMEKLAVQLLDIGWESVAAKVMCDKMHFLATIASTEGLTADHPSAKAIVEQATHASRVSRSAGCFRRQVKADSIGAMWAPDPLEGRVQLLGNIRASEETKSVEPGLLGGLGGALLVCDLRARLNTGQSIKNLRRLTYDLFDEAGLDRAYIYEALKYWIPFTPASVIHYMTDLATEMNVEFTNKPVN